MNNNKPEMDALDVIDDSFHSFTKAITTVASPHVPHTTSTMHNKIHGQLVEIYTTTI